MKKFRRILSGCIVSLMLAMVFVPTASYALPTSYSGKRVYNSSGYRSYTWSNGYETGGNVNNTVQAWITRSLAKSKYGKGEIYVYSLYDVGGQAGHGVGTGADVQYTWYAN